MTNVHPLVGVDKERTAGNAALLPPELLAAIQGKPEDKPKVAESEDDFGKVIEDESQIVPITMEMDAEGRLHFILPASIPYAATRNTTKHGRRSIVCRVQGEDTNVPYTLTKSNGQEITVNLRLSSTLNLSASAVKV